MKAVALLDVNLLVALMWPAHSLHTIALRWFEEKARYGWATCPFTQAGFVRISSNRAASREAPSPQEAWETLYVNTQHPKHVFWPAEIGYGEALDLSGARVVGHKQITDAYLLGLAAHHRGRLATLDKGIAALLPAGSKPPYLLEIVGR